MEREEEKKKDMQSGFVFHHLDSAVCRKSSACLRLPLLCDLKYTEHTHTYNTHYTLHHTRTLHSCNSWTSHSEKELICLPKDFWTQLQEAQTTPQTCRRNPERHQEQTRTLNWVPVWGRSAEETSRTEPQPPKRSFLQPYTTTGMSDSW